MKRTFTIRSTLLILAALAFLLAQLGNENVRLRKQRLAVEKLKSADILVTYKPYASAPLGFIARPLYGRDAYTFVVKARHPEPATTGLLFGIPVKTDDVLTHIGFLEKLEQLDLRATSTTSAGIEHVESLSHLKVLVLADTLIDNNALAGVSRMSNLEELVLEGTRVNNVKPLTALRGLRILDLGLTGVGDDDIADLAKFGKLELLRVDDAKFSDDGIRRLRRALPNCRVATKSRYLSHNDF